MANDVHDGTYTVFAYNDESMDISFADLRIPEEVYWQMYGYSDVTPVDSALLAVDGDSDSLLLTMYGRDTLDVDTKFMQGGD